MNCFWAGEVIVELKLDNSDKLKVSQSSVTEYKGYKIILLDVSPIGMAGNNKSKKKYSAKLKVI